MSWAKALHEKLYFLLNRGPHSQITTHDSVSVIIRGYAARASAEGRNDESISDYILEYYRKHQGIPVEHLEGSFSVVVIDARAGRILIFRNIAGAVNIYYRQIEDQFVFSTNLRDLLDTCRPLTSLNSDLLPVFFLFRCVPGRETLYRDVYRVLPGDLVCVDCHGLTHRKVQTFDDFSGTLTVDNDVVHQVDETLSVAMQDCLRNTRRSAVLLSGGVDSTLLQSHWNTFNGSTSNRISFCATVDHPVTSPEVEYAQSAAKHLGIKLVCVAADRPYLEYLTQVIQQTGETPNHVQAAYFPAVAREMLQQGIDTGISGEAGDGIFGVGTMYDLQYAERLRSRIHFPAACLFLARLCVLPRLERLKMHLTNAAHINDLEYMDHPINQQAMFGHLPSVIKCFGDKGVREALRYRRQLISENGLEGSLVEQLHAANLLTSSINSASLWNTLFETQGAQMLSPFLDSRVLRLAMNIRESVRFPFRHEKVLLKECLARRTTEELAYRKKLGFGQPIFEWLGEGGQLRPLVDMIDSYEFVDKNALEQSLKTPNWFLYNLLCFDQMMKHWL